MKTAKIPEVTIMRLTTYSRYLLHLKETGKKLLHQEKLLRLQVQHLLKLERILPILENLVLEELAMM
ncbi:hypothetical protein AZF37_05875 [endosymbiont 'TC1' of Trimyema compressum]|uniref:winged-helix domain-containing protein n=1 Tax=endosymbiont 'TC1' of Trimyema compressum TaxID=243899 RepID=UPI0007F07885|nr:winged-helix domain-containing protein [endosymbiont 'TC1' of Trimyema compressum]AMP20768.1 hypothetical protein AZF37_05875 [endosymbiont 'TC1' of Trimyema compressum]